MGLSSSQARLLHLTSRMHDIEYKAQRLEAQKLQMANESTRVYQEYENALNKSKVQYKSVGSDGSAVFTDATLASLENGIVSDYEGKTSGTTYFLYDNVNNRLLVTPEVAAEYGLETDLDQYLTDHGCTKEPVTRTEYYSDYNNIRSVTPVENSITTPVWVETVQDPDTYSLTGSLPTIEDKSHDKIYQYTPSGTVPTVASSMYTDKYKYVVNNNTDATSSTINIQSPVDVTTVTNDEYLIPANQTFKNIESTTYSFNKEDLDLTMQELSDKYEWNWDFKDSKYNGYTLNTVKMFYDESELNSLYGISTKNLSPEYTYNASTKLSDILSYFASLSSTVTFDSTAGTITNLGSKFRFSSNDDENSPNSYASYELEKYLEENKSFSYSSTIQTFSSNTLMKDFITSDKNNSYGDFSIYDANNNKVACTDGYNTTPPTDFTYKDYLDYLASDSELSAAGFTWWEDEDGIHSSIGNGYKIKNIDHADDSFLGKEYISENLTKTTNITINQNAIAENIYLARSIISGSTSSDYTRNKDITSILGEINSAYNNLSIDSDKRQLVLFSENLSDALKSGKNENIQEALNQLGSTISSTKYIAGAETPTTNVSGNKETTTTVINVINYTFDDTEINLTPDTTQIKDGINKGTLTVASNDDMNSYLAYQLFNDYKNNGGKSYDEYLTDITSKNYDAYQLAELVKEYSTYKASLASGTDLSSILTKYDSTHYNLSQATENKYTVTDNSIEARTIVNTASTDDILDKLAYDVYTAMNVGRTEGVDYEGNPNDIKSDLRSIFTDRQLASLNYYSDKEDWTTIVNNLASSKTEASVDAYVHKYDSYDDVNFNASVTDETIDTQHHSHKEMRQGEVSIPDMKGIASNVLVAFRKLGIKIDVADESKVEENLTRLYGADNDANNLTLANINEVVCKYLKSGSNSSDISNIYNNLYKGKSLNITTTYKYNSTYKMNEYKAVREDKGVADVTYGFSSKEVKTGAWRWKEDDNYTYWYNKFNSQTFRGYTIQVIDEKYCNKTELIENYIENGASLIKFGADENNPFSMEDANVATETNLQEVSDETALKKAEAKYEADMRKIDAKDKRYDTELAALDTERNAIKTEVDTLKSVAKENVDRTFKLFS